MKKILHIFGFFHGQVFSKNYRPDGVSSGYGIPVKQHPLNFTPHMLYQKQQLPYFDPASAKSTKYADLFINPVAPSSSYSFGSIGGGVDVYPVDITNTIPETTNTHKLETFPDQQKMPSNNVSNDLESMIFGKADMDFGSLLSMLTPDNKLDDVQTADSSSYLIPSLDFLSEASPQLQTKVPDNGYETSLNGASVQPFGLHDISVMENSNTIPVMSEEQTFWDGVDKLNTTSTVANASEPSPSASMSLSLDMASPMDDPFMAGLFSDEPTLSFPADNSRYYETATPTSDIYQTGLAGERSPSQVSAQSSPVTPASEDGEMASASWDNNLQELFKKSVDMSDMMELDFMLPPPTKRRPDARLPRTGDQDINTKNPEDWSASDSVPREVKLEPVSPQEVGSPPETSPDDVVDAMSERGGDGKTKTTILFGKHEDEIIYKLLAPQPGALNKPVSRDKLVSMPVEEFNQLLEQACLSEIEVAFMKEWRRRGKNKAAAQVARKRKREEVTDLDGEVKALRRQKAELNKKYDRLRSQIASLKKRSIAAEDRVYRQQTKLTGKTVSRNTHLIHLTDDDKLLLVPRISSQVLTINK